MALALNNLRKPAGSTHKKKRLGRGPGSGLGKTSGKGHKGQKSRSGYSAKIGFEGGQMPLQRRLPKRGFTNIFKKEWLEISLAKLESSFEAGDTVTPEILHERGLIKKAKHDLVVLGNGELTKALKISAHRFTKGAKTKIEKAGGTMTEIEQKATFNSQENKRSAGRAGNVADGRETKPEAKEAKQKAKKEKPETKETKEVKEAKPAAEKVKAEVPAAEEAPRETAAPAEEVKAEAPAQEAAEETGEEAKEE
jgi:large subunit ribosomal protein L15